LSEEGNHQAHALEVFNATAQKVVNDAISYGRIQVNNTYYKEVLGEKMNKKLGSSHIYLAEEQYNKLNVSMSFYIQCSLLVFTWHTDSSLFRWLFCDSKTASRFVKNSVSFDLLLNLRPNLRRRDRTVETIRSIDMALMGISGRGSTW
jgi:hypothetical protein